MATITDAEVGQEVATNCILSKIVLTAVPTSYSDDYFCLTDGDRVLYNIHIGTSPVSAGSVLMDNETILFESLTVKSIPVGCTLDYELTEPPTLASLSPDTAVSGDPDLTLSCTGTGFTGRTVIKFGDHDEPTTLVSDTEVTTGVKPSLFAPAVVPVLVHNGPISTDPLDFTFTEPAVEEAPEEAPPAE